MGNMQDIYQPTEYSPSFSMTSEVTFDKLEFLHMFDHLRSYKIWSRQHIINIRFI